MQSGYYMSNNPRDCEECGLTTRGGPHWCEKEILRKPSILRQLYTLIKIQNEINESLWGKSYIGSAVGMKFKEALEDAEKYLENEERK